MKFGIKRKLLLTYILAIIIPVIVVIILFGLFDIYINQNEDFNNIKQNEHIINSTLYQIQENYDVIDNYDQFYMNVVSEIEGSDNEIIIVDLEGNLLFHSKDKEAAINHHPYELSNQSYYDINYIKGERLVRVIVPLMDGNQAVGTIELTIDQVQLSEDQLSQIMYAILFIILIGILVLIILITIFSSFVSKGVINPLNHLSEVARNIALGNLEQSIEYDKKDELGEFSKTFDMMRVKLKTSLEHQQRLENDRKALIASISHDLKTPITSIKGYVEAVKDHKYTNQEKLNEYLHIIYNKTNQLDHLINDLFQFSQLELENMKLDKIVLNSRDLLEEVLSGYYLEFEYSNIELIVDDSVPQVLLNVDTYAIKRVFDNILQNAKKYIKDNGIITINTYIKSDYFEVRIADNGIGIKPEDLPQIFNRFYRGEKSRSRKYGGVGLGLAICKEIIKQHNGKIWVESTYQEGSTFYFNLPIYKK